VKGERLQKARRQDLIGVDVVTADRDATPGNRLDPRII
jgi:hypothetical protein